MKLFKISFTFSFIFLIFSLGCQKERTIPNVSTNSIISIYDTAIITGGNVIDEGKSPVTIRGVCWDIKPNPTVDNSKTKDGAGLGIFTSSIKLFMPNTTYHVRAYAINSNGTAYGQDITFNSNKTTPIVSTTEPSLITSTTADIGGIIIHDGGEELLSYGICWSNNQNPTISDNKIAATSNNTSFSCNLTGLSYYTTYFARAFAENSLGISYGPLISFKTRSEITAIDYDGNIYNALTFGTQVWMIENLKVIHYRNGDPIEYIPDGTTWETLSNGAYCFYNNDTANKNIYGPLYNWYAVGDNRKIAPEGWHVATDIEWKVLYNFLGGSSAVGKMKMYGTNYGSTFNSGATNESNFSIVPNGMRFDSGYGHFQSLNGGAFFWCGNQCTTCSGNSDAYSIWLSSVCHFYVDDMNRGFAVRCVKD
jgi:uncharacterized protein (TIGR02145 family)